MENTYFYTVAGKQHGPVSFEELKQLAIRDELGRRDKVWRKGMKEWQSAGSVAGLFENPPHELESERRQPVTQSSAAEVREPIVNRNHAVSQGSGQRRRIALASVVVFALLQSVIGGEYAVHAHRINTIKEQIAALQAGMNDNLRQGLTGIGRDSHGVNLMGDGVNIRTHWGVALRQARQIAELASAVEQSENGFPLNKLCRQIKGLVLGIRTEPPGNPFPGAKWDVHDLEVTLEILGQIERIPHAVFNQEQAALMVSFVSQANSIAFKIHQPLPFPQTEDQRSPFR